MSFLKSLTKEFKGLMGDDKDKDKNQAQSSDPYAQGGTPQSQPYGQQSPYGQLPSGQPQQYGQPQLNGQPQQFGSPAPYGSPAPTSGGSNLSPGWIQQWDQNSQRWYYVETATGRTQWEPPAFSPPSAQGPYAPPPMGGYPSSQGAPGDDHTKGMFAGGSTGAEAYDTKEKKKSGTGKLLAVGALGAVGGAVVAHEMTEDSSDDEHQRQSTSYASAPGAYGAPAYGTPMGGPPPADIDSSDAESLASARDDVQDAKEELAEASSESDRESAREDLEEAQEEYEEEQEEAYDD